MQELDKSDWRGAKNREAHDSLLEEYCHAKGGVTFGEVKVLDDPYPRPREIDGVRFSSRACKLKTWSRGDPEFQEELSRARRDRRVVEIIEVTTDSILNNRGIVGQVVVGAWLLEEQGVRAKMILVCPAVGTGLKKLLVKHGIKVWSPERRQVMRRPRFRFFEMGIVLGAVLRWAKNKDVQAVVVSNTRVRFRGQEKSLTAATTDCLTYRDHPCPHWTTIIGGVERRLSDLYEQRYGPLP